MIILKFKIPIKFYLNRGPTPESLYLATSFKYKKHKIDIKLLGEDPLNYVINNKYKPPFFRKISDLEVTIHDNNDASLKNIIVNTQDYKKLFEFIIKIRNRCLRSLRNWGYASSINDTIFLDIKDIEYYFFEWDVKYSADAENWNNIFPEPDTKEILFRREGINIPSIELNRWAEIEEAIQNNLEPPPEQEFIINSIEHLNNKNYRISLIESIIALEIVFNEFLKLYFSFYFGLDNSKISKFLNPQLGLTAKISVLLNMCLEQDELKKIKFDEILKGIDLRNTIIHKTGQLKSNYSIEELNQIILSILLLVQILAKKRDFIKSSPELQRISKKIAEKFSTSAPLIKPLNKHKLFVRFTYTNLKEIPEKRIILEIINELIYVFKERDKAFNENKHLYINFNILEDVVIRWVMGRLEFVE
jgi:hypothetical protein